MKLTKLESKIVDEIIKKAELIEQQLYQQSDSVNGLLHKQFHIETDEQVTLDSALATLKDLYEYHEKQGRDFINLLKHFKGE